MRPFFAGTIRMQSHHDDDGGAVALMHVWVGDGVAHTTAVDPDGVVLLREVYTGPAPLGFGPGKWGMTVVLADALRSGFFGHVTLAQPGSVDAETFDSVVAFLAERMPYITEAMNHE